MVTWRARIGRKVRRLRLRWARATQPVLGPFRAKWRRSLMMRTMTVTGLVTGFTILVAGVFIVTSVSDDLYSSRRDQALLDSARATLAAQSQIDASDRGSLSTLSATVRRTVQDTSSSQLVYLRRQPGQPAYPEAPPASRTNDMLPEAVTVELSAAVAVGDKPQLWQAVTFTGEDDIPAPGIIVASTLTFPAGAGDYDLFIGYSLADTQDTLSFVQRTLAVTAAVMMVFIGLLVWIISRIVFRPIRTAAATSRKLAAGEASARMPMQNDEHLDVLSEGFNDMADTLQSRIQELDQLSDMQQRFVSDVSHELRTPLTTIRLASEMLESAASGLGPGQQRAIEVLGTQVERFESLLGDLLEISRYDAGHVTLETEPTNLVNLVEETAEALRPLSPGEIQVHAAGGYAPIDADPRRLRRIVSNLIGNAIEHGEGGAIEVSIDSNSTAVAVNVRDRGIGMTDEHVEHVFDRFWRADPSRKRTLGGTGLGLAIAQEDAAVHGGLLEVWSRPGEGTNFRLTLPRGDAVRSFVSPLPLVPEGYEDSPVHPYFAGRWLKRPSRMIRKEKRQ